MRKAILIAAVALLLASAGQARVYYGGAHHTSSHGGHFSGAYGGSSHRGGHYTSRTGSHHYGCHR